MKIRKVLWLLLSGFLFMFLRATPASAEQVEINCRWTNVMGGETAEWRRECDYVDLPPAPFEVPPDGSGGGCPTCGGPTAEELARRERCAANARARTAMQCDTKANMPPTITEQLGIPSRYSTAGTFANAVLTFANNSFATSATGANISTALSTGLAACGNESLCVQEVQVYFGQRIYAAPDIPVIGNVASFLDYIVQRINPSSYERSDAAQMVKPYENGKNCIDKKNEAIADRCGT